MSAMAFEKQGNTLTVRPAGRIDTATSPLLERELRTRLEDIQAVILDLSNVEYVSSAGLRLMLATAQRMEDRGGSMKVIHVKEHILEVFELVGFMDVVSVEPD